MIDDLTEDEDGATEHSVVGRGEERNLEFWMLGFLGFRMRGLARLRSSKLEEV
jgi:hypothetical protein